MTLAKAHTGNMKARQVWDKQSFEISTGVQSYATSVHARFACKPHGNPSAPKRASRQSEPQAWLPFEAEEREREREREEKVGG
jgi:hypothetical protein